MFGRFSKSALAASAVAVPSLGYNLFYSHKLRALEVQNSQLQNELAQKQQNELAEKQRKEAEAIQKTEDEENAKQAIDQGIIKRMKTAREFYRNLLLEMNRK